MYEVIVSRSNIVWIVNSTWIYVHYVCTYVRTYGRTFQNLWTHICTCANLWLIYLRTIALLICIKSLFFLRGAS
jgi:hypothetical protein